MVPNHALMGEGGRRHRILWYRRIDEEIARGLPPGTAARASGLDDRRLREWLAIGSGRTDHWGDGSPVHPETREELATFAGRVAEAVAQCEAEHIRRIEEASRTANAKTGIPEWRASAWLLNNHPAYRERYHEHREVTIDQTVTLSPEQRLVRQMSTEELRKLVGEEDPLRLPEQRAGA